MNNPRVEALAFAVFLSALVAGCDNKPISPEAKDMPQTNAVNCTPENIAKVNAVVQQQFADACTRRGSFKPSTGRTY